MAEAPFPHEHDASKGAVAYADAQTLTRSIWEDRTQCHAFSATLVEPEAEWIARRLSGSSK